MPWHIGFFATLIALVVSLAGCRSDNSGSATVRPASTPATQIVAEGQSALAAARLDAAKRLGADALSVELHDLHTAGFSSSCVGVVTSPSQACTDDLGAGFFAFFRAGSNDLRYHFLGRKYVGPVAASQVGGVSDLPSSLHSDIAVQLSLYARVDFALRQNVTPASLAIVAVAPWDDGTIVVLEGGSKSASYRVALSSGASLLSSPPQIPPSIVSIEMAMRQDLAKRLNVDLATVSILSYETVTWPDGCLGVQKPGTVCTQALIPGFFAILSDSAGKTYRYHGTGDTYTAASFESQTLTDPIWNP